MDIKENTEIQLSAPKPVQGVVAKNGAFSGDIKSFEDAQRMAGALASSTLIPKDYQKNMPNCMIALEMAQRVNANPMAVMQNLHVIHGKPSWSSQFVIAALNGCGRFTALRFHMFGDENSDSFGCMVYCNDADTGEQLTGPKVTIAMAKAEGWYSKNGSKWKTMPELMLRYRSAKFFGNLYAPDILMGMSTNDEMQDIHSRPSREIKEPQNTQGFNPQENKKQTFTVENEAKQEKQLNTEDF